MPTLPPPLSFSRHNRVRKDGSNRETDSTEDFRDKVKTDVFIPSGIVKTLHAWKKGEVGLNSCTRQNLLLEWMTVSILTSSTVISPGWLRFRRPTIYSYSIPENQVKSKREVKNITRETSRKPFRQFYQRRVSRSAWRTVARDNRDVELRDCSGFTMPVSLNRRRWV